jgi:glutamine synthetase
MEASLKQKLKDAGIRFVRIIWCDNANIIRAKAVHIDYLDDCIDNGVGISLAQMALPVMYDSVIADTGLGPVGEVRLMPDWSTLTLLPFAKGHAQVMSDMIVPATNRGWDHCPRGFLRRQVAEMEEMGLVLKAAFENEFFLLQRDPEGALQPADHTVFCATGAMNRHRDFIAELTDSLMAQGLEVEGYYPESGPGQQELAIVYAEALRAADRQIVYRETVRGEATRHGLVASFLPKIFESTAGSGCHLNFSLWRKGQNISGDPRQDTGISPQAGAFLAGILHHLPALCAVTIPSKTSYRRIQPHSWAGAFRVWGHQNREAAIRVCKDNKGTRAMRFEYKTADATANPYLALGSLVAAGLDGLKGKRELPPEVDVDPGLIPEGERNTRGIDRLPLNLGEALDALRNDSVILNAMGTALARSYIAVRQEEWNHFKDLDLEQEVNMLVERY